MDLIFIPVALSHALFRSRTSIPAQPCRWSTQAHRIRARPCFIDLSDTKPRLVLTERAELVIL